MPSEYDYDNYGAFKQVHAGTSSLKALARRIGLKNRYLRFFDRTKTGGQVVEIGCGDGSFMKELRAAGFAHVQGVDLSPSYADADDVHVGDATAYLRDHAPGSIDYVVALDVFEHIPQNELRDLLRIARDRLTGDGRIIFRVPNMGSPLALLNQHGDLSHVNAFNEVSVRQIAFDVGLDVEAVHPEPLAYPRSVGAVIGLTLWPAYRTLTRMVLAAFGVRGRVLTPNLIGVLKRPA